MFTRAFATAAGAVLLATTAAAEQLPTWNIADVCRGDSAPGQCGMFERRARNAVSGSWDVLPPETQAACIAATRSPGDQSWRALAGCIELETLQAKRERAIATGSTPSKAEPPAPVPVEPAKDEPAAAEPATTEPAAPATAPAAPTEPDKAG
jgi:hypothetical protein